MSTSTTPAYSLILVIFALAMGGFCIGTTEFVAMGLIQEIAQDLNISYANAGYFISAYALGVVVGAPVIAILAAQLPRKNLLISLMLFYGLANAATAFATSSEAILISRFIAGLPHGAFFGIAALVVAELAGMHRRTSAIAQMMMGLTVATVIGVPFATWLGQNFGWRAGFNFSASIAVLTLIAIIIFVPSIPNHASSSIKNELKGLKNTQMWLTLSIGAIGFGGMFSVYTYVSPILTHYTQASISNVPFALAIFGIGMVIGGLVAGYFADKNLNKTIVAVLLGSACAFILASFLMSNWYSALVALFFIGFTIIGLSGPLQARLMDVAGDAQGLAASLNHSAFNLSNALGAFVGGWVLKENMGWLAPVWAGILFSLAGLVLFFIALAAERKN